MPLAQPVITGYHYRAIPLSIIGTHDACFPWVLENFIQLRCYKSVVDQHGMLDFVDLDMLHFPTPWLDIQRIDRALFDRYLPDFKQFLTDCIQDGYYVHVYVDEFFVPNRSPFGKEHIPHDLLISGYDDEAAEFDVAGFDEQGLYKQTKITYQQLQEATSKDSPLLSVQNPLLLVRIKAADYPGFNVAKIVTWLTAYLHAEDYAGHYTTVALRDPFVYGLEVYEALCNYLQSGLDQYIELETRPFQMLLERSQLMQHRLMYLQECNYLPNAQQFIQAYKEFEKNAQATRNVLIKYQITGLEQLVQKMQNQLLTMQAKEREIIEEILRRLQ